MGNDAWETIRTKRVGKRKRVSKLGALKTPMVPTLRISELGPLRKKRGYGVWLSFLEASGISKTIGFEIPWFLG